MTTNIPAFPLYYPETDSDLEHYQPGMMLRDYFAAAALQGCIAGKNVLKPDDGKRVSLEKISFWCYEMADAMLDARSKS
jgi:hypothetical protein